MAQATITNLHTGDKFKTPWTVNITYVPPPGTVVLVPCTLSYATEDRSVYAERDQHHPDKWTATFDHPPDSGTAEVQLQVVPRDAAENPIPGDASDLISVFVVDTHAVLRKPNDYASNKRKGSHGGTIAINSPLSGTSVSVTFTAAGTIIDAITNNVAGSITAGGVVYPGSTVVQGPGWQISFSQPASATGALLEVWCVQDDIVMAQATIDIVSGGGSAHHGGGGGVNN